MTESTANISEEYMQKLKRACDNIEKEGEALGLPQNQIEAAKATALGTFESGKILVSPWRLHN